MSFLTEKERLSTKEQLLAYLQSDPRSFIQGLSTDAQLKALKKAQAERDIARKERRKGSLGRPEWRKERDKQRAVRRATGQCRLVSHIIDDAHKFLDES